MTSANVPAEPRAQCPQRFDCPKCRCILDAGHPEPCDQHCGQPHTHDDRRAQQIATVRDVLERNGLGAVFRAGPESILRARVTGELATFAGQLVDAVLGATGMCGESSGPMLFDHPPVHCVLPASHGGLWHEAAGGMRWRPADEPDTRAEAAGYARAVTALRDTHRYHAWWNEQKPEPDQLIVGGDRSHLADYLEAVGPGTQPMGGTGATVPADLLGDTQPQPHDVIHDQAARAGLDQLDAADEMTLAQVMDGAREREVG